MTFKKCYYRPQIDIKDCGVAALAMVFEYYGSHYSLATIRELAKTTQNGTTAFGLMEAAETLHVHAQAIQADMSLFDANDLSFPFVVHVIKNKSFLHYYTVIGCDKRDIHIADPDSSIGIARLPREKFEREWTGVTLLFTPSESYMPYKEKKKGLLFFVPLLKRHKKIIFKIIGAMLFITSINIIGSYYLQSIIDRYIPYQMFNVLGIISMGLMVGYIMQQLIVYIQSQLLVGLSQKLSVDIILSYVKHVLKLPISFFSTRRTGEIFSRFSDANVIIEALTSLVLSSFLDIFVIIIISVVLYLQHPILFGVALTIVPIYMGIIYVFMKPFDKMNQKVMESNAKLSSSIIENINGIETIKALSTEDISFKKINVEFKLFLKTAHAYYKIENIQRGIKTVIHLLLNVIILWAGANLIIAGQMTLGQLITFNMLLIYFTNSLENIVNLQTKLQKAYVANERLEEIYRIESEFSTEQSQSEFIDSKKTIKFEQIRFRYGYGTDILKNINLNIEEGSKVAIVGTSGSGKTTLAKLLVNFYEPSEGHIKLNDINLKQVGKKRLRQLITYIPQQPYIFNGTILDNLLLGAPENTTKKDIDAVLELVELREDILKLPLKLDTELTSEGTELSGGQKQKIALARGLLKKTSILILDEATSNLDLLTEKKILAHLLMLKQTILFIAHRLTIAEKVDRVIVLHEGVLIEEGTHNSLLEKGGYYAHLINS